MKTIKDRAESIMSDPQTEVSVSGERSPLMTFLKHSIASAALLSSVACATVDHDMTENIAPIEVSESKVTEVTKGEDDSFKNGGFLGDMLVSVGSAANSVVMTTSRVTGTLVEVGSQVGESTMETVGEGFDYVADSRAVKAVTESNFAVQTSQLIDETSDSVMNSDIVVQSSQLMDEASKSVAKSADNIVESDSVQETSQAVAQSSVGGFFSDLVDNFNKGETDTNEIFDRYKESKSNEQENVEDSVASLK